MLDDFEKMNKIPPEPSPLEITFYDAVFFSFMLFMLGLAAYIVVETINFQSSIQNWTLLIVYVLQFLSANVFLMFIQKKRGQVFEIQWLSSVKPIILPAATFFFFASLFTSEILVGLIPTNGLLSDHYEQMLATFNEILKYPKVGIITAVFFAPVLEELFFRGLILRGLLNTKMKPLLSILFTAILFGALHFYVWQVANAILLGLALGIIYYFTRALWLSILFHMANNTLSALLYIKDSSGEMSELIDGWRFLQPIFILSVPVFLFLMARLSGKPKLI